MKNFLTSALLTALFVSFGCLAAAPTGAPAGVSGLCKDGTYDSSAKKAGACSGHKGVRDWWGKAPAATADAKAGDKVKPENNAKVEASKSVAPKAAATAAAAGTAATGTIANSSPAKPASNAAPMAAKPADTKVAANPVAGGGTDKVWVNEDTKVYHCPGGHWYGKTKNGKYMSEADAKAAGARPDRNKPCK
jgi:hypothetical protein